MPLVTSALLCLVVAFTDGDTLKVRCGEPDAYQQVTVRLAQIDAPEKKQPFGQRSKEALSTLCFDAWATLTPTARDRYGRTVARVQCDGVDANAAQVRAGMAWSYTRYLTDAQMPELEQRARATRGPVAGCSAGGALGLARGKESHGGSTQGATQRWTCTGQRQLI